MTILETCASRPNCWRVSPARLQLLVAAGRFLCSVDEMPRKTTPTGPRLEALLDERDHLRIQISLAENGDSVEPEIKEDLAAKLLR